MTIPEIKALKRELEDAMLQAFTDFERMTGTRIHDIDLICLIDKSLLEVTVQLESL